MKDWWFAECLPCGWQTKHETQDAAIAAAEDHVFAHHRKVPAEVRGDKKMGHVQNRTEDAAVEHAPAGASLPGSVAHESTDEATSSPALKDAPQKTE